MRKIISLILLIALSSGCLASNKAKDDKATIDQLQLQEEIQRFYTRFTERMAEAILNNTGLIHNHRKEILRQYTLYDSESLKIATSPYPEINLLDMMAFISTNKAVVKRYWIPKYFGKSGLPLLKAFQESEKDITDISIRVFGSDRTNRIHKGVNQWLAGNPDAFRVEKLRVAEFAKFAKVAVDDKSSFSLSNFFVDTKSAVKAVDQMVLVANRGIFLAQSMPYIMRLHTRLGVSEVIEDSIANIEDTGSLIQKMEETNPLIENATELTSKLEHLSSNALQLVQEMNKHPKRYHLMDMLNKSDSLLDKTNILLQELDKHDSEVFTKEIKSLMWTAALLLILVGVMISAAWWTGYYVSKRMLR